MLSPYPELENAIREIDGVLVAARAAALLHVTRTRPCMNLVQSGADMVNLLNVEYNTPNYDSEGRSLR